MAIEWDIRGWKRLSVHDDPPLAGARGEFLGWLAEVPECHRVDLEARLKSDLDHNHLSARLELFVHHLFASRKCGIEIHPDLPDSDNHPDFLVKPNGGHMLLECKTVLDRPATAQQEQRLRQLATEISRKLGVAVMLHPLADLPSSLPATRIRNEIEARVREGPVAEVQELEIRGTHRDTPYAFKAVVLLSLNGEDSTAGVQGLMSQAQIVNNRELLREALGEKAGKYGRLTLPFLIVVSAETEFPATTEDEQAALFGDKVLTVHSGGRTTETRRLNGLFTLSREGAPRYSQVSAVLVYRFKWLDNGHEHRIHLYHNPFAAKPIDLEVFPDVPQFAMAWVGGEPEPY